jgi:predicted permease
MEPDGGVDWKHPEPEGGRDMKQLAKMRSWARAMTRRSELDGDMQCELEFHIESYAEDLMRNGASREEAMRRARLELGSVEARKEDCRESLGLRLCDDLLADLRYGLRMLKKSPGFTSIAVVSLALGIGANTIIFTLAKEVLLDTLPVAHPEQLRLFTYENSRNKSPIHSAWGDFNPGPNGGTLSTSFSYPVYRILREHNRGLGDLMAFKYLGGYNRLTATIDGGAQTASAELVSGNYYSVLGIGTALGRPIQPSDDARPGEGAVAVISDGYWARAFGRSPSVIGKTINLNLTPVTIVGVNQPSFTSATSVQTAADFFVPLSMQPVLLPKGKESLLSDKDLWWVQIMGRAKPDLSDAAALATLSVALDQAIRATLTVANDSTMPQLTLPSGARGLNHAGRNLGTQIHVLLALAGLVLLLACANIANLLLARSAARQREVSVRMALGASRGRILRQVLTESLLLSLIGGCAGLLLGYLGRNAIPQLLANSWEQQPLQARFDWKIFAFTAGISILTGLLFGVAPAAQSTHVGVNSGLKDNATSVTRRRKGLAGKAIVVFQISLSMLLVVGAGLFARTLINLDKIDVGFRPENVLLFHLQPPHTRYPYPKDISLERRIEEKLNSISGVDSVTLSAAPLLAHDMSNDYFVPDGQGHDETKQKESADVNYVGESFFSTMGISILGGRGFNSRDTETSPKVAVVNQALARKFFPSANPIGKTFNKEHIQIVGIVSDAKYDDLRDQDPPTFYAPYRQAPEGEMDGPTYELRLKSDPASILPAVREAVASIDKDLPLIDVRTQIEQIDALLSQERLFAVLTAAFGVLALILACIGIYGLMAYSVARRINEIGIRMALGAQNGQVLRMILGEASWMAVVGIGVGLGCAVWLTRFLASLLYGLKPSDPSTLAGAGLLLLGTALAAGWVPAWRASRVQPMEALRHE